MIACSKVTHFQTFKVNALFNFHIGAEVGEKHLALIISIVSAIFVIILLAIIAYFIYQNRRLKSSKANPENKSKDRNNSQDIYENPDDDVANYEQVENEQSTYMYWKGLERRKTGLERRKMIINYMPIKLKYTRITLIRRKPGFKVALARNPFAVYLVDKLNIEKQVGIHLLNNWTFQLK